MYSFNMLLLTQGMEDDRDFLLAYISEQIVMALLNIMMTRPCPSFYFFTSLAPLKGGCVAMATGHATGLWEVKECASTRSKYICRQDKGSSFFPSPPKPQPTPPVTGTCPPDWKSSSTLHYCYKVGVGFGCV